MKASAPALLPEKSAACYLRVSSIEQSVKHQREAVLSLARSRGFKPVVFEEQESAVKERPVFERLLADVRAGKVQAVVVWALDRLQRSMVGALQTVLELDKLDIPVMSCQESWLDTTGPTRSLLIGIFGWVGEQERLRIRERTMSGARDEAKLGNLQGRPPYARTWDKEEKVWGVIDSEFTIYKRLFRDYEAGLSCRKLAEKLNAEGVPAPGSWWHDGTAKFAWSSGSIFRLLSHRSAVGEVTSYGKKIACTPIVDVETFERVQVRLSARNLLAGRPAGKDLNALLRGLATCGHCGSSVWVARGGCKGRYVLYYSCARYQTAKEPECRKRHRVEKIDADLKDWMSKWLEGKLTRAVDTRKKVTASPEADIQQATRDLKRIDAEEMKLARLTRRGVLSEKTGQSQLAEVAKERAEATHRLDRAKLSVASAKEAAKAGHDRKARIKALRKKVKDGGFDAWNELVRAALPRGAARLSSAGDLDLDLLEP